MMFDRPAINISSIRMTGFRPHFESIKLAGYQPAVVARSHRMSQLVSLNPNIAVSVQTGIEQYLFPAGLLAGGAAMFVLGTAIPKDVRPWTTIAGLVLLGAGVGVLIYRGTKGAAGAPAAATPPPPSGGVPVESGGAAPPAFQPPSPDSFRVLQLEVVSPQPDQSVNSSGGFLFFGSKKIPVQLRMYNPATEQITFNLDFVWDEMPGFTGYNREPSHGSASFQVTLGPGEEKNQTFDLPIQTSVSWTQIQTDLAIYKKRTPAEVQQLLSNITFTVT